MTKITAAEINKLRQITGAGMMDCKAALTENDGDIQKAIDWLRKKGQKIAEKRAGRVAGEGYVCAKVNSDSSFAAIIMLNCETDFVAKNDDFVNFAQSIVSVAIKEQPTNIEDLKKIVIDGRTISDLISDQIGKIGEKIELNAYHYINAPKVFAYNHHGNRIATIIGMNKADVDGIDNIGKEVCMQVTAMNPIAIDKDGVEESVIEREIEIGKEQARQEGKPEAMLEKIAKGKLNKFFKEKTLLNQEYIADGKITVSQAISSIDKELKVTAFHRIALGE